MTTLWSAEDLVLATAGRRRTAFAAEGVAIDSRRLAPGDLFVALRDQRDGHDFVLDAFQRGAAGAMVDHVPPGLPADAPLLVVGDTLAGLTALGAYGRVRSGAKIIAVTGSVGKTSTKEMLRVVLAGQTGVHAAEASYNNHWGVPLTLARLPADAGAAVIEIGMNHAGEIAPLARITRPHVAIITAIAPAHLGPLGSLEAIAREKAALLEGLLPEGVAILPAESAFLPRLLEFAGGRRVITFGGAGEVPLLAFAGDALGSEVTTVIGGREISFRLGVPGRHMAVNALAALAAVFASGFDPAAGAAALAGFAGLAGRGARRQLRLPSGEITLIDESYNASPASVRAALAVLGRHNGARRIAVLGDMLELGDAGPDEHAALAAEAAADADLVFTAGPLMAGLFAAIPAGSRGAHAPDSAALAPRLLARLRAGDVVLVKGSLGSRMSLVIDALAREAR